MPFHRNKSTKYSIIISTLVLVVIACNFITGKSPITSPTEINPQKETSEPLQSLLSPNSTPMSDGLTLKSAADTERELTSYQATYLEDQAEDFSPKNQNEIDMYFGENHNFTVHVNSSKQPLVWATGWCAQGQETLSQNLKKIQFEMRVNGQPVDLNQVYRSDNVRSLHTAGSYCLLYRIIVSDWASGTTTLISKTIINEPVNDGNKNYPAGELVRTYEVINPAATNQTPNSPISGRPTLGSKEETQSAIDDNVKSLTSLASKAPFSYNGITRYDVKLNNSNEHLLWWSNGWCATNEKILAKNLEKISFELYMDDQPIDLGKAVSSSYKSSDGLSCFGYAMVMYGWTSNTTVLTSKVIIKSSLNDGIGDYSAGDEFTKNIVINGP
jgi:hypothetical protein